MKSPNITGSVFTLIPILNIIPVHFQKPSQLNGSFSSSGTEMGVVGEGFLSGSSGTISYSLWVNKKE
jgi:hypothetical protein